MYLLVSPFVRTSKVDLEKIAKIDKFNDLIAFIDANQNWNNEVDRRVSRALLPYQKKYDYWIILDLTIPRISSSPEEQLEDTVNAECIENMISEYAFIPIEPHHKAIPVLAFSEFFPDNISYALQEVFAQLNLIAQGVCLDSETYAAREQEFYDNLIDQTVRERSLNWAAHRWLLKQYEIRQGMSGAEYAIDSVLERTTNPFWWAKVWKCVPDKIVHAVYKKRGMVIVGSTHSKKWRVFRPDVVQSRMPFRVKRTRRLFAERWRGISAKDGNLVWVGKYVV